MFFQNDGTRLVLHRGASAAVAEGGERGAMPWSLVDWDGGNLLYIFIYIHTILIY